MNIRKYDPGGKFRFQPKGLGQQGEFDPVNLGGQALKYIVPAARLLGNQRALRNLRKDSKLNFDPVSLYHGAVRDIPRPNMTPRYRPAAGSSLSEFVSGQKYADAAQRQMEADFNVTNASSRIQQEKGIRDSMNQERLLNANLQASARQFNAQNAQNEKLMRMANQEELELGLTETALNDLSQRNYLDAAKKASAAGNILRYGDPGSPEYQRALKYYMDTIGEMNMGGKLKRKTKFSYGG